MERTIAHRVSPIVAALLAALAGCGSVGPVADDRREVTIAARGANAISTWGQVAFTAIGSTNQDLVTVHLAMHDAVMAVARTHRPFAIRPATSGQGAGEVGMKAAAVEAAYRTLRALAPAAGASYEARYAADIAALPDGDARSRGRAIGSEVAAGWLARRANDGRSTVLPPYVPGSQPGQFRGLNPINRIGPQIKPFATLSHSQFRAPGPPPLASEAYAADVNEVQSLASTTSTLRSAAQTEVARFHTEPPPPFWSRNLRQFATASDDLAENARLAAMLYTAHHDAVAACFESKYHHDFWRPTSAIQLADTDGNAATRPDANWAPHLPTPNHPEYPAAHSCASAAVAEVLRSFYGTRKVRFSFDSTVPGTLPHRYESTDDLVREIADARVWGGMHFRFSTTHGAELGRRVAEWVAKHHFQPAD
ncbi:MAG: vanadium-dependent haloperoxidase [Rubrivivax sp.]